MAKYGSLSFAEAIAFFGGKLNIPTERWADVWRQGHDVGFMVAGAAKAQLLEDLRDAVEKIIAEGTTLQQFRKDFDALVARHGWSYKGSRGWRTRVIFDTNLRQAYHAGREAQMAEPELRRRRPYGLYRHGDSTTPRPLHLSWDGLVLPLDDLWWESHTPMNGWGCKCKKFMISEREAQRRGLEVGGAPDDGTYEWTDKVTGEVHEIPRGIDPGFDYRPGATRQDLIARSALDQALGITTTPEQFAADVEAWQTRALGFWARQHDMTLPELIEAVDARVREELASAEVWVRIRHGAVPDILERGYLAHADKKKLANWGSQLQIDRRRMEQEVLGLADDLPPERRPAYGYLTRDPAGALASWSDEGDVAIRLTAEARQRATTLNGRAIDLVYGGPRQLPRPLAAPDRRLLQMGSDVRGADPLTFQLEDDVVQGKGFQAQIHNGLHLQDIEELVYTRRPGAATRRALDQAGIRWRVADEAELAPRDFDDALDF